MRLNQTGTKVPDRAATTMIEEVLYEDLLLDDLLILGNFQFLKCESLEANLLSDFVTFCIYDSHCPGCKFFVH